MKQVFEHPLYKKVRREIEKLNTVQIFAVALVIIGIGSVVYYENQRGAVSAGAIFTVASSTGTAYFTVTKEGRVGIGTEKPATSLEVAGPIRLTAKSAEGCSGETAGEIAFNPDNGHFWGCTSNGWRQLDN